MYRDPVYDFASMMHYSQCAFSNCGTCDDTTPNCWTIDVRPPWDTTWQSVIGQRDSLTYWDKKSMSFMYPESGTVFFFGDHPDSDNDGTFMDPYTDFATAVSAVPGGGTLIFLYADTVSAVGTYSSPMTIDAGHGSARLE
jgi:hypothetical protein